METAIASHSSIGIADEMINAAEESFRRWLDRCDYFRNWERTEIILGNPSKEDSAQHKRALAAILRSTRWMLTLASDPESFNSESYSRLSILNEQMQHSWDMLYAQPPAAEAAQKEALLSELFPA